MNITELLTEDHREVESLIAELEDGGDQQTFGKLKRALKMHTQVEEEIYYPALEDFEEISDLVDESYQEHDEVDQLLEDMSGVEPNSEEFQELLSKLKDNIEHHVEEEENKLFPQSEELLGTDVLDTMGDEMQRMKNDTTLGAAGV